MAFDIERLLQHVRVLAIDYPHRHAGEPDQVLAAQYIADELSAAGLAVHLTETPILGWEVTGTPSLELVTPESKALEFAPYVYSGSTPPGGIRGRLVRLGWSLGAGARWRKFAIVDEQDAPRALIIGRTDGPAMGRRGTPAGSGMTADGPSYSQPSCMIGAGDTAMLDALLDQGVAVTVRYACTTRHKPNCPSITVRGVLRGQKHPEEVVVFGVHHDAIGAIGYPAYVDSPGANDNASGVAILIETARMLAQSGVDKTIWFCSFDGEERNLMGSADFVRTHLENGDLNKVVAYVGIDQAAYGDRFWVLASGDAPHLQPRVDLSALSQQVISRIGLAARAGVAAPSPLHAASDHWPFYHAGVPAILTGWHPFPEYHRGGDTFELCTNDEQFLTTADTTLELLRAVLALPVSGAIERPATRGFLVTPPPA